MNQAATGFRNSHTQALNFNSCLYSSGWDGYKNVVLGQHVGREIARSIWTHWHKVNNHLMMWTLSCRYWYLCVVRPSYFFSAIWSIHQNKCPSHPSLNWPTHLPTNSLSNVTVSSCDGVEFISFLPGAFTLPSTYIIPFTAITAPSIFAHFLILFLWWWKLKYYLFKDLKNRSDSESPLNICIEASTFSLKALIVFWSYLFVWLFN